MNPATIAVAASRPSNILMYGVRRCVVIRVLIVGESAEVSDFSEYIIYLRSIVREVKPWPNDCPLAICGLRFPIWKKARDTGRSPLPSVSRRE